MSIGSFLFGPYFDFLVVDDKDSLYERRGRVQRIVGIKSEFFHHPDAFVVPDALINLYVYCFIDSHPSFNYYGETLYENDQLDALDRCLNNWMRELDKVDDEAGKKMLTGQLIESSFREGDLSTTSWSLIKSHITMSIEGILEYVNKARKNQKVLLVLGV